MKKQKILWRQYFLEFLFIFVGISLAFALNNWNENRRDRHAEKKILEEIKNGLELDLKDIQLNKNGHLYGIESAQLFRDLINNKSPQQKNIKRRFTALVRDFTTIMNLTGYESLKSKGLEIISNDALRYQVIALYDHYYQIVQKLEEQVTEMQLFESYFMPINEILLPHMKFDKKGQLIGFEQPMNIDPKLRKRLLSYLWRIEDNRRFKITRYTLAEEKVERLIKAISQTLTEDGGARRL